MEPRPSFLIPSHKGVVQNPDGLSRLARKAEFGRVMQDEHEAVNRLEAFPRGLKVPSQNRRLTDSRIGEKPIGGLRVGPILTGQRDALSKPAGKLPDQLLKPPAKPRVAELAAGQFLVKRFAGSSTR